MTDKQEPCDALAEILESLERLAKDYNNSDKISKSMLDEFLELSVSFSKHLPKMTDTTLFEIDNLLFPYDEATLQDLSSVQSEDLTVAINMKCFKKYFRLYQKTSYNSPPNRTLDKTCLRIINASSEKMTYSFIGDVLYSIEDLFKSRYTLNVCTALKLFKVTLQSCRDKTITLLQKRDYYSYLFFYLLNLQNIPECNHPQQKLISSWILKQTTAIIEIIDKVSFEYPFHVKRYFNKYNLDPKHFDAMHAYSLTETDVNSISFHTDHLYEFFMSAKNEEEKIKRLKDFLTGMAYPVISPNSPLFDNSQVDEFLNSAKTPEERHECIYDLLSGEAFPIPEGDEELQLDAEPSTRLAMECIYHFMTIFHESFELHFGKNDACRYPDGVLRDIERRYGCPVESYLTGDKDNDYNFAAEELGLHETVSTSTTSEDEPDYTIERFLFFDDFVKKLQVLNILHYAFMKCQELIGCDNDVTGHDNELFRKSDSYLKEFFTHAIENPDKRGYIPWVVEILFKKCPFMILPKRHAYLAADLIKLLKGENISEVTEEKLIFAIYSSKITKNKGYF